MTTTSLGPVLANLFGTASRNLDIALKRIDPTRYVEHDPRVPGSIKGLRQHISRLPPIDYRFKVVRVFSDGPLIVAQSEGTLKGQTTVFFDVFKLEDDLVVEHWGFSAPGGPPNKSGHTQADGPTQSRHHADTERNKKLVQSYYQTVHIEGHHERIREWFDGDICVRHEPGVQDGINAFLRDLAVATKSRTIDEIKLVVGEGDFVFIAARGTHQELPCLYIDLYRAENDKIVEHWGFFEDVPSEKEWKNTNGII